jgi:hypothetical protein
VSFASGRSRPMDSHDALVLASRVARQPRHRPHCQAPRRMVILPSVTTFGRSAGVSQSLCPGAPGRRRKTEGDTQHEDMLDTMIKSVRFV